MVKTDNQQYAAILPQRMAFFSWDLTQDKLYGDAPLAELFGLGSSQLAEGVPILALVDRIAPDDRARIAKSIHTAITTGLPYQETYRIEPQANRGVAVIAAGRCFRDPDGSPSLFAGMIIDVTDTNISVGSDLLELYCQAALDLAQTRGDDLAARYLSSALRAMGGTPAVSE